MQRRMLALFAGIAVAASAMLGAAPAVADHHGGAAYVALGDSEAAGTGLLPYSDAECKRSLKSYPTVLGSAYGGVASFACAGATTQATMHQAYAASQSGSLGPATEIVTITAGVNDLGWQQLLLACSSAGSPQACQAGFNEAALASLSLPQRIAELVTIVRSLAPSAQIVVGGYPLLFGDLVAPCSIGSFAGAEVSVGPAQAAMANDALTNVNLAIRAGALGMGATWVDIGTSFDGHGLCDTGSPWVSGLVNGNPTSDRSLHLTWPGQRAYAAAIAAEL